MILCTVLNSFLNCVASIVGQTVTTSECSMVCFTKLIVLPKGGFIHAIGKGLYSYNLVTLTMYPKVFGNHTWLGLIQTCN